MPRRIAHNRGKWNIELKRRRLGLDLKLRIREAFGWECQYCGFICPEDERDTHLHDPCDLHDYAARQWMHIDRIVPGAKGGDYSFDNITLSCRRCNSDKHVGLPPKSVKTFADVLRGRE